MNEKEEHTMRACTKFFEDIENLSCNSRTLGEAVSIAAKLMSLQREENIEGLQALSERLGVDVTSPVLDLAAGIKLVFQTIQEIQKEPDERTRGNFPGGPDGCHSATHDGLYTMKHEQVLHIGFQNYVLGERIVAILGAEGIPMKRLRNEAYQHGKLIDATRGRKTHALILTDSDHVILSIVCPDILMKRWNNTTTN